VRRKEAKSYGTRKIVEGCFQKGQHCLVVEDLVTTGGSVIETVEELRKVELVIKDVVVLVDREQGARDVLKAKGFSLHSVFSISELAQILHKEGILEDKMVQTVLNFISENKIAPPEPTIQTEKLSFLERAKLAPHPIGARLFNIMEKKHSNLCVAVDLTSKREVLDLARLIGSEICMLKTHADIINDFDADFVVQLKAIADELNFIVFEDRKFADIGNTLQLQLTSGLHQISSWADIVTVHGVAGPAIIDALKAANPKVALLLLAEMSSKGTLATGEYTQAILQMGQEHKDTVIGFISTKRLDGVDPSFVFCTPGVQFESQGDALGQQYNTPTSVVGSKFSDVVIVGRGIYQSEDAKSEAVKYKTAAWDAYKSRLAR